MYFGTEGDSWPTTWLQDNTQLTAAGDRGDFGTHMSMWRVNGTAPTTKKKGKKRRKKRRQLGTTSRCSLSAASSGRKGTT